MEMNDAEGHVHVLVFCVNDPTPERSHSGPPSLQSRPHLNIQSTTDAQSKAPPYIFFFF